MPAKSVATSVTRSLATSSSSSFRVDLEQGVGGNRPSDDVRPLQRARAEIGVRLVQSRSDRAAGATH